jgi:hypothetical protein
MKSCIYDFFKNLWESSQYRYRSMIRHIFLITFLNNCLTSAYFNLEEKIPDDSNLLQMWFKGELINGELNFNTFTEISS